MHDQIARQEVPLPRPLPRVADHPQFASPKIWPAWAWVAIAAVIIAPIVFVFGFLAVGGAMVATRTAATPVVPPAPSLPTDAEVYAQANDFIRELLVAPKTAEFAEAGKVTKLIDSDRHAWRVESTFDAQNKYGVFLRGKYKAEIHFSPSDQMWSLELAYVDDELRYASKEVKQSLRKMQAAFSVDTRAAALFGAWRHDAAATRKANPRAERQAVAWQLNAWRNHRIEFRDDGFYLNDKNQERSEPWIIWSLVEKDGNDFVLSLDVNDDKPLPLRVESISRDLIGIEWGKGVLTVYSREPADPNSGSNQAIPKS